LETHQGRTAFDEISHDWLLTHVPMNKRVLKKWLKAGYMEKNAFHHTEKGTPQGGIISPILANLCLDGLEACIANTGRERRKHKLNVIPNPLSFPRSETVKERQFLA
jgi:retron-type reverse transcriptase